MILGKYTQIHFSGKKEDKKKMKFLLPLLMLFAVSECMLNTQMVLSPSAFTLLNEAFKVTNLFWANVQEFVTANEPLTTTKDQVLEFVDHWYQQFKKKQWKEYYAMNIHWSWFWWFIDIDFIETFFLLQRIDNKLVGTELLFFCFICSTFCRIS